MFSTRDIEIKFGVTKLTVHNWIRSGKVKPRKFEIGKRYYYGFSLAEVNAIAKMLKPKKEWKSGQSLLYDRNVVKNKGKSKTRNK